MQSQSAGKGDCHCCSTRRLARVPRAQTERVRCSGFPLDQSHRGRQLSLTIPSDMILDALHRIANHGQSLDRAESREVMAEVLAGNCADSQIAALLLALQKQFVPPPRPCHSHLPSPKKASRPTPFTSAAPVVMRWSIPAALEATRAELSIFQPPRHL